jgi:hypothetical protein
MEPNAAKIETLIRQLLIESLLLALGGVHNDQIMKWKQKASEAEAQDVFKPQ